MKTRDVRKRQHILSAAVDLFSRAHDVKKVSLEAIAGQARVSPTTIYNHFGTRENLVFEVIKNLVSANIERNRALIRSNLPFAEKIIGIVSGKIDVAAKLNAEIIQKMMSQDREIAPFVDSIVENEIKPLWLEMLADGKRQGYIDPEMDDRALMAYLDIMQAGARARPEILREYQENTGFVKDLTRLMFCGILKKEIDLFRKEARQSNG